MRKTPKPSYSVAMSKETGAIVMVRTNGHQVTVIGAMSREDSVEFVKGIMEWPLVWRQIQTIELPKPSIPCVGSKPITPAKQALIDQTIAHWFVIETGLEWRSCGVPGCEICTQWKPNA